MLDVEEIRRLLRLEPHPVEGGFFAETFRSRDRTPGSRTLATAIYYLLTPGTFSAMHRLRSDEVFHFYLGDPVEMLQLDPDGAARVVGIGTDLAAGLRPQVLVPRGVWQGSRVRPGGSFALLGTTVSPGFEYEDYEPGARDALSRRWPEFAPLISALTR
jgi:predicted cupin superfamily sugar epimerase